MDLQEAKITVWVSNSFSRVSILWEPLCSAMCQSIFWYIPNLMWVCISQKKILCNLLCRLKSMYFLQTRFLSPKKNAIIPQYECLKGCYSSCKTLIYLVKFSWVKKISEKCQNLLRNALYDFNKRKISGHVSFWLCIKCSH